MAVTLTEAWDSRSGTFGKDRRDPELIYVAQGSDDDQDIRNAVILTLPASYAGAVLQNYGIERVAELIWIVRARYGTRERKEVGDSTFSFDTTGGTEHVTQSIETVNKYAPPSKTAPDFQGAIGVSKDAVEGVDIVVPKYGWTETHYLADGAVTGGYRASVYGLTGKTNQASFRGFSAGEVLFLGASGSKRGVDDWEVSFGFVASPNLTGITVGDITGINKKGWEYLWVRYADHVDQNVLIKRPIAAYVEKVYYDGNFGGLGIGS